jgi:hypothetical protein
MLVHFITIKLILSILFLQVFIAIAVILGDGLYNFFKIMYKSGRELYVHYRTRSQLPVSQAAGA